MTPKSLSISNFKSFGAAAASVPLKPITLVFGPNSAGKSSLLHGLLWLREGILQGNLDVQEPLGLNDVNLGGFDQIVHRHEAGRIPVIGWTLAGAGIEEGVGGWNRMESFELNLGFKKRNNVVETSLVSIATPQGLFFRATRKESGAWMIDILDWEHPALRALSSASGTPPSEMDRLVTESLPSDLLEFTTVNLLPERLKPKSPGAGWLLGKAVPEAFRNLFDAFRASMAGTLQSLTYIPPLRQQPPRGFDPLRSDDYWRAIANDSQLRDRLNGWIGNKKFFSSPYRIEILHYLREDTIKDHLPKSIRDTIIGWIGKQVETDVDFMISQARSRWETSPDRVKYGKMCPAFWERAIDNELDFFNNEYDEQGHPDWPEYSDEKKRDIAEHLVEDIFSNDDNNGDEEEPFLKFLLDDKETQDFVSEKLDEHGTGDAITNTISADSVFKRSEMLLRDVKKDTLVSFQDVGVGISQVIPVAAQAYARKKSFIVIEQPEIHIHPALQAELGDVFIESALGENKNTFLLETHSEHLILRILRRIRETTRNKRPEGAIPVRPDDIAVLYVEPGDDGSIVRELRVSDQGRFIDDWPNGFFEERFNEEF